MCVCVCVCVCVTCSGILRLKCKSQQKKVIIHIANYEIKSLQIDQNYVSTLICCEDMGFPVIGVQC